MTSQELSDALSIRPLRASDLLTLARMFEVFQTDLAGLDASRLLHPSLPSAYGQAYLDKTLAEVEQLGGTFLVAEEASEIAGFAVGVLERVTDIQRMENSVRKPGRLTELYVAPGQRSQGIGSRLLQTIEEWFRGQDCDCVRIEVFAPNVRARQFYRRHGYDDWLVDTLKSLQ